MNAIIISKYLSNECSEREKLQLEVWLAADDNNAIEFEACKNIWNKTETLQPLISAEETEIAWQKFKMKLKKNEKTVSFADQPQKIFTTIINRKWLRKIAAALIPITMITWYIINNQFVKLTETKTGKGERTEIVLPDGTKVWLNAESSLRYPESFSNKGKREVYLTGEAYFKVKSDKKNMFKVYTNDVVAKAYGTSFNVKSYEDNENILVSLDEGKLLVEIENSDNELEINPGQFASIDKDDQKMALDSIRNDHNLWIENKIIFQNEPLASVVKTLNRWYNVNIQITNNKLNDCKFTGSFDDSTLDSVLAILKETLNLTIEKKDQHIKISGEGC